MSGGRARTEEAATRINAAVVLLESGMPVAEAARVLAERFSCSVRQGRRYAERAVQGGRVSSARQKKDETIGSQTAALRAHAEQQGLKVPAEWIFEDEGHSGATLVRPALERLRDLVAGVGVDVVLCYSPDRLARKFAYQALLLEEFGRAGTRVEFIKGPRGDSPEDQLLVQFQGMFAEYEKAQLMERYRRGKTYRARTGSVNASMSWRPTPPPPRSCGASTPSSSRARGTWRSPSGSTPSRSPPRLAMTRIATRIGRGSAGPSTPSARSLSTRATPATRSGTASAATRSYWISTTWPPATWAACAGTPPTPGSLSRPGFVGGYDALASGLIIVWSCPISQSFSYSAGGIFPQAEWSLS